MRRSMRQKLVVRDRIELSTGEVRLRCTLAEFGKLDPAEETQFLPGTPDTRAMTPEQVLSAPYYVPQAVTTYDAVPLDEVELRRGEHIHAADGPSGESRGWSSTLTATT